jgi:MFS transporter, ACS family, glucarate transporter
VKVSSLPQRPQKPSHVRYGVIAFGATLAVLSYIARVCIAQSAPFISRDLSLNKSQLGTVFGIFLISYGLFEIPAAWYGDWVGPRRGLLRIVLAWSAFTAMTGLAWNYASLVTIRLFFGIGEAGAFPMITKSFTTWLPKKERTWSQGVLWTSARWAGAFTPLIVVWTLRYMSWRWSFVLFGSVGCVWAFFFFAWYRDNPREHPGVNAEELELLEGVEPPSREHARVPWKRLFTSRAVLLLSLQYFFVSFSWYFYLTWLPTYLQENFRLSPARAARYAVFPLLFCGIGSLFCGFFSKRLAGRVGTQRMRQYMACSGFLGAGLFLGLAARMSTVQAMMSFMAIACFFNDQIVPNSWASCMDIGGKYASSVAGTMNVMGNLAGAASSSIGGYLLQRTGNNWTLFVELLAAVYFLGIFCWPFIDTQASLEPLTQASATDVPGYGSV